VSALIIRRQRCVFFPTQQIDVLIQVVQFDFASNLFGVGSVTDHDERQIRNLTPRYRNRADRIDDAPVEDQYPRKEYDRTTFEQLKISGSGLRSDKTFGIFRRIAND